MPGFTAEAALYVTNGYYRLVSNSSTLEAGRKVVPQRIRIYGVGCDFSECCVVYTRTINGLDIPQFACRPNTNVA